MSLVKYRLKEVATDFGVTPKDIAQIMEQFFEKPKSNTQVLTEDELNVIFDVITAKNAGMPCISVLWGFRNEAEIRENGGTAYLRSFEVGGHSPKLVGEPLQKVSGNAVLNGEPIEIPPAVEEAFIWIRNFT